MCFMTQKIMSNETKNTSDSMYSMFSVGITAFYGIKVPLRQINQRNLIHVISLTFCSFQNQYNMHGLVVTVDMFILQKDMKHNKTMIFRVTKLQDSVQTQSKKLMVF